LSKVSECGGISDWTAQSLACGLVRFLRLEVSRPVTTILMTPVVAEVVYDKLAQEWVARLQRPEKIRDGGGIGAGLRGCHAGPGIYIVVILVVVRLRAERSAGYDRQQQAERQGGDERRSIDVHDCLRSRRGGSGAGMRDFGWEREG
jgi:hypothetical protein